MYLGWMEYFLLVCCILEPKLSILWDCSRTNELILCHIDQRSPFFYGNMLKVVSEMLCARGGQKLRPYLCAQVSGFHTSKVK